MSSNLRIQRLRHRRDFLETTDEALGLRVLTNVSFNGDTPEAIRLNLASPNSSLRRSDERSQFSRSETPFAIHNPAVMLSSDQLVGLQDNFAVIHEALGDSRLGNTPIDDDRNKSILSMIQARSYEIVWIDSLLDSLSLNSTLHRSYLSHPRTVDLSNKDVAASLLTSFQEASDLYSQLPELRAYSVQGDVQTENIGPRGERFRLWLQQNASIRSGGDLALDYVAYALRPLRMSGRDFKWKQGLPGEDVVMDLRLAAVDLLLRFDVHPVWCEVKAKGDTWTSSAMQQILFYGSMLSSGNQKRRCRRHFLDQFQCFQPWLGILVEDRDDPQFQADYEQTLTFASSENFRNSLKDSFGGIVFGMIQEASNGWTISRSKIIRWN